MYYIAKYKKFKNGKIKLREYEEALSNASGCSTEQDARSKRRKEGEIDRRSLSRTKNNLVEIVENNEDRFVSFLTLTYKEEVESVNKAYRDLRSYIKSCKRTLKKRIKICFTWLFLKFSKNEHRRRGNM